MDQPVVNITSPVCPGCGCQVPLDTVWIYQQRFFCTQDCVVKFRTRRV